MIHSYEKQLEAVVEEWESQERSHAPFSSSDFANLQTRCLAAIERASSRSSTYRTQCEQYAKQNVGFSVQLGRQIGVAKALLSDIRNDHLVTFEEQVHGDLFGDFLEIAQNLIKAKNKDAAAILTGTTLEVHIRKLGAKHGVKTKLGQKSLGAEAINAELTKIGVYSKLDQKNVTAWLGLRNHAVHGDFAQYNSDQAKLLIANVRDFITRHPA